MTQRTLGLYAALSFAAAAATVAPAAAETKVYSIESGHSITVPAAGLSRVAVGDAAVAGVVPIGTSQVIINAKQAGHTTVIVWSGSGESTYEINVVEQGIDDFIKLVRTAIDEPSVEVFASGANVILRGTVPTAEDYARIENVLAAFAPDAKSGASSYKVQTKLPGGDKIPIVNLVKVASSFDEYAAFEHDVASLPGGQTVHIASDGSGSVIISGHVHDGVEAAHIMSEVKGLSGRYLPATAKLVDRLTTDEQTQINVRVYVLEVDKQASSTLGLRLQGATFQNGTVTYGDPSFSAYDNPSRDMGLGSLIRTTRLGATLDLLMGSGHARLLSAPNLTTTPDKDATFLVGGEIPYAYSAGNGVVSIVFQQYGVQLDVTPSILGDGSIESVIKPEVSQLDYAHGISLNGFTIPGLTTSKLSTDVITHPGESIILGGLLKHLEQKTITKIPGLASLPILGKLFTSTQYLDQKTDVVFVMTPEVISR